MTEPILLILPILSTQGQMIGDQDNDEVENRSEVKHLMYSEVFSIGRIISLIGFLTSLGNILPHSLREKWEEWGSILLCFVCPVTRYTIKKYVF